MNSHSVSVSVPPDHSARAGEAEALCWALNRVARWRVGRPGGLAVEGTRVWLTRDGDPHDPVLAPGQGLALQAGERITVEPWSAGTGARLVWSPTASAQRGGVLRAAGLARTTAPAWRRAWAG